MSHRPLRSALGMLDRLRALARLAWEWFGRRARSAMTRVLEGRLGSPGVPQLSVFSDCLDGVSQVEVVDLPPSFGSRLEVAALASTQPLRCQVIWRGEPLDTAGGDDPCLWIDAPRAAALAFEAGPLRPWREGKAWTLLVVIIGPDSIEAHFVRGPGTRPDPAEVGSTTIAVDGSIGSLAKVIDSILGRRKRPGPTLLVTGPGPTAPRMARFQAEAARLNIPQLGPRDVLRGYARAWVARLDSVGVEWSENDVSSWRIEIPQSLWGTVARASLVTSGTPSQASWTLEMEGMGLSGGRLDLTLATVKGGHAGRSPGQLNSHRLVFDLPMSPAEFLEPIEAELSVCPATRSARLLGPWSGSCRRCGLSTGDRRDPGRLARPSALLPGRCERCGADSRVKWPSGPRPSPGPTREPRPIAMAVLIMAGPDSPHPAFVRRAKALLDALGRMGRATTLAVERSGVSRRVEFSGKFGESVKDGRMSIAHLADGTVAKTAIATGRLEDTLNLMLARTPTVEGGVFLLIIADRYAELGPGSFLATDEGAWAWLLAARRGLRRPIHFAVCAELREEARRGFTLALESLVLRGAQAFHGENLVHWWTPVVNPELAGREDAAAVHAVVNRCETRDQDAKLLRVVASRSFRP